MAPVLRRHAAAAFILSATLALPAAAAPPKQGAKKAAPARTGAASYARSDEARRFAADVSARRGLPRSWLEAQLAHAASTPAV